MNDLIAKLAEQSGMEPDVLDESEGTIWWLGNNDLAKFAELIILECASIVDNDSTLTGIVGADLKEHFGVQ
jgi:hypothetical protein